jgi:1,4-alpha-glucan branching enzyme
VSLKYFSLVLHSHIPYVIAHGDWPHGMDWLYEAAAESYVPLLDIFFRLAEEGISPQVNISFTPVLMDQLKNPYFREGFEAYLKMKIEAAGRDRRDFEKSGQPEFEQLAIYWEGWYERIFLRYIEKYRADILEAFRILQDSGHIEVLTSGASHAYFPLLSRDETIELQIRQGKHVYGHFMGKPPKGFWIPECAYRPSYSWKRPFGDQDSYPRRGLDEILEKEGLGYFFVDSRLLRGGEAKGVYADRFPALRQLWEKFKDQYVPEQASSKTPYSPYLAYPSNLPFFVRDEVSGSQVWSRSRGYPGDGWYLEFHKKHFPGGLRYWRITTPDADLAEKAPYDVRKTVERMEDHAAHFVDILRGSLKERKAGIVVGLYDTELFGHWWFEGPEWLYRVLKKLATTEVRPLISSRSLDEIPPETVISLPEGSWGQGGFHWIWLNEDTSWIWEKIYRIEDRAADLDQASLSKEAGSRRLLKQFFREKFLLESSDWPFLISTRSARDYAEIRATEHYERAAAILSWLEKGALLTEEEARRLESWEQEDGIFEELVIANGTHI